MIEKNAEKATSSPARSETRVDQCGQSSFEVWLPSDKLRSFEAWFEADLDALEQRFQHFATRSSCQKTLREGR